jgi:hypothetical protein
MPSYSEYYRQRLDSQTSRLVELDKCILKIYHITGKKRKYEEAMGYHIDSDHENFKESISIKLNEYPN